MRGTPEERLDVLDGSRGTRREKAALRVEDLQGLASVAAKLKSSKAVGDPPTKDEFDALVDDVHGMHKRLLAVAQAVGLRLR